MNAILEQLKEYFSNTPRDVIEKEWHEYDKYNEIGPTINEYLAFLDQILVKTERKPIEPTKINETPNFYSEFFYIFAVNREDTSIRVEKASTIRTFRERQALWLRARTCSAAVSVPQEIT